MDGAVYVAFCGQMNHRIKGVGRPKLGQGVNISDVQVVKMIVWRLTDGY